MEETDECATKAAELFAAYGGAPWEKQLQLWAENSPTDVAIASLNAKVKV